MPPSIVPEEKGIAAFTVPLLQEGLSQGKGESRNETAVPIAALHVAAAMPIMAKVVLKSSAAATAYGRENTREEAGRSIVPVV